jgi:hypothetical protein
VKVRLLVKTSGDVRCLHTDAIDLRKLGRLEVERASNVEFNDKAQSWEVSLPDGTLLQGGFARRDEALAWEREYFEARL